MFTYSAASSVISFECLTDVLISTCSMRSFQFPIYPIICLPHYSLYRWQCNNPLKANNMSHPWLFAFNMHLIYQKILSTLLKIHTECECMSPLTASLYFKNILALSFWYKDISIVPGDQGTLETWWHLGGRRPVKHWHKVSVKGGRAHLELMESCHSGMAELWTKKFIV